MRMTTITATVTTIALAASPTAAYAAHGSPGRPLGCAANTCTAQAELLSATQKGTLVAMAEEEKLAHDVYLELTRRYPDNPIFARIARSESRHMAALRNAMTRYGVSDPTKGLEEGEFLTMQKLYDDLLASATTATAATKVGIKIERLDIADLRQAINESQPRLLTRVYSHLLRGSQHHLVAFQSA